MSIGEELKQRCVKNLIPHAVYFVLTQRCNQRCRHCYISENDGQSELSAAEIKDILDQLLAMSTFYITFTGGESLVRQDFFEIASYARQIGFVLSLLTNGILIGPDEADKIKELKPREVYISLLGATPEVHDAITGVVGSFARTIKAIKLLVSHNISVVTKTVLMDLNVHQCQQIEALVAELGCSSHIGLGLTPCEDGSLCPQQYDPSVEDVQKYLSDKALGANYLLKRENPRQGLICNAGKAVAAISPWGEVWPCLVMPISMGNLRHKSFTQIWHVTDNELLNQLRSITEADLTTCAGCQLLSFCIRCPGTAYLETKSLLEPSPSACKYAQWRASFVAQRSHG